MRNPLSDHDKKSHDKFKAVIATFKKIISALETDGRLQSSQALDRLKKDIDYPVEWVTTPLSQAVRLKLIQDRIAQNQPFHCIWYEYQKSSHTKARHRDLVHFLSCELDRMKSNDADFSKNGIETEKVVALRKLIFMTMFRHISPLVIDEKVTEVMGMRRGFFSPKSLTNLNHFFRKQQEKAPVLYVPPTVPPALPDPFCLL